MFHQIVLYFWWCIQSFYHLTSVVHQRWHFGQKWFSVCVIFRFDRHWWKHIRLKIQCEHENLVFEICLFCENRFEIWLKHSIYSHTLKNDVIEIFENPKQFFFVKHKCEMFRKNFFILMLLSTFNCKNKSLPQLFPFTLNEVNWWIITWSWLSSSPFVQIVPLRHFVSAYRRNLAQKRCLHWSNIDVFDYVSFRDRCELFLCQNYSEKTFKWLGFK